VDAKRLLVRPGELFRLLPRPCHPLSLQSPRRRGLGHPPTDDFGAPRFNLRRRNGRLSSYAFMGELPVSRIGTLGVFIVALMWSLPVSAADFLVDGVPLPRDARVAPSRGAPENLRQFLGAWVGAWGGQLRHILIIENAGHDGKASVVYAVGDNPARNIRRQWHRLSATISGNTLHVELSVEITATYEVTASGKLSANYNGPSGQSGAMLSKIELADLLHPGATIAWTKPVEPLDRPPQGGNPPVTIATAPPAPVTTPSAVQSSSAADFLVDDVPIPRDARVAPPSGAPENVRQFSGAWVGAWGGLLRHILIVEKAGADGKASVVYAVGDNPARNIRRQWHRHSATISGNTLRVESFATYEMTTSGMLSANYSAANGRDSALLSKIEFADLVHSGATISWAKPGEPLATPLQGGNPSVTSVTTSPPAPVTTHSAVQSSSVMRPQGRRVALVIGVSHYEHEQSLSNTLNDARDMDAALKRVGFDVEMVLDPSRIALEAAIRRYGDRSAGAEASVLHYSGHALEAAGHNWLLPATMNLNTERDLRFEAVDLDTVLEQTDAAKVSIIFLDACRDNPFLRRLLAARRNVATRGLARVETGAAGMLVAFSTSPGQVALDGSGRNSPFTAALLHHIETPGLEIRSLLGRVTKDVVDETQGAQRPWVNSSLEGDFYLLPLPEAPFANDLEALFWDSIKASSNPADFKVYLAKFPNGLFAELAQNRLTMLEQEGRPRPQAAVTASPQVPATQNDAPTAPFHDQLLARFAALSVRADERETRARDYEADTNYKAIAVAPIAHRTWRARRSSDQGAVTAALESCQLFWREPCILAAVGDRTTTEFQGFSGSSDMPRTRYAGLFDPGQILSVDESLLRRPDVASYRSHSGPKAAAWHPWGRLFIVAGGGGQFEAEELALSQCNSDTDRNGRDGLCFLYSVGDQVVLPQRAVKPLSAR
jgi:hypothetical protein